MVRRALALLCAASAVRATPSEGCQDCCHNHDCRLGFNMMPGICCSSSLVACCPAHSYCVSNDGHIQCSNTPQTHTHTSRHSHGGYTYAYGQNPFADVMVGLFTLVVVMSLVLCCCAVYAQQQREREQELARQQMMYAQGQPVHGYPQGGVVHHHHDCAPPPPPLCPATQAAALSRARARAQRAAAR